MSQSGQAADPAPIQPAQDSSEDAPNGRTLGKISVTATRNPIEAFEYPGMVTVIGREEIKSRQASTPDDVLRFVPNVEFIGGPRRTGEVPSIRGFSGPDVIVTFDGARQNFGSAHDGRFFIDPSLLKEVEVLRGPASSLYGSGGTGGVIEFRTIDAADVLGPEETIGLELSGGYQSVNDEPFGTATVVSTPFEGLDLVGSLTKRTSGTIQLGDGTELENNDDDIIAGLAKAGYAFADVHRIEGSFITFNNDTEEPNNGQGAGDSNLVDKEIRSNTFRAAYSYKNPSDSLLDLDVVTYYTDFQVDERRLDDQGAGPAGELLKRDVATFGTRIDNRSRFLFSDDISTTFTYGGEFYRDVQDGAAGDGDRDGVPDADSNFYGLFSQAEVIVSEPFGVVPGDVLIIPGLRFDSYESSSDVADGNDDQKLSPRIGLSYLPNDNLMLFASYAEAFRAPSFDELFLTGVHFEIPIGAGVINNFVPNPDLKPQTTQTVEFGGGLTFQDIAQRNDIFQFKASHFRIWGHDFIDFSVDQPRPFVDCNPNIPGNCDGTSNLVNVPDAKLWGTEVEASYESDRLLIGLGFSAINGKNEDTGEKLGVLTPNQYTVNTALKLPEIDSVIGWNMLAAARFENVNDPDEERSAYSVHDFYFSWQPSAELLRGFRVDLGIDNAFDENYERVFTGVSEAGRNFKAMVGYSISW